MPFGKMFRVTETPNKPRQVVHVDVFYRLQKTLYLTLTHYLSTVGDIEKIITDNELGFKVLSFFFSKETEHRNSFHI